MATANNYRGYRLHALINNGEGGIDQLNENTKYQISSLGHHHSFQIEREMKVDDTLTIIDEYAYYDLYAFTEYKCSTNRQEHSCSHITGRLIKRI